MPPNMVSPKQKKKKDKADKKDTINTVLFVQRHESPSHPLLSSSFLAPLGGFFIVSRCRKTKQTGGRKDKSIDQSSPGQGIFDKLGWKTEEALLGYLSQLEHTRNTLVQTQQTVSANFFPFLVAKKGSISIFQILLQRFQGLKGLEVCRRA
jgi:hypothetical protein